jgi:hypothetical protein
MSDYLPGFSSKDQAKPPTKRELQAMERDYRALVTWYQTGDEGKVRDALKLPSKAAAKVAINRAVETWRDEMGDHVGRVRALSDHLTLLSARKLAEKVEAGELRYVKDLMSVLERLSKLHGLDAQKEEAGGPQVVVIDSRPPWERGETIDGEADDDPPALPAKT